MKQIYMKQMTSFFKQLTQLIPVSQNKAQGAAICNLALWKKHRTFIIALLGICLVFYFSKTFYAWVTNAQNTKLPPVPVETVQIKEQSMQQTIQTLGILSGVQEAKLKAAGHGRVQNLLATPGSWVEMGTLLMHIAGGPDVRAPFAGYITDYQVKIGELVTAGTELVDLVNTKKMLLTYRVPEHYSHQLKIGQRVDLKVLAFKNKTFQAEVRYISPVIDKKTFTILVRAELNNPDQALKPGMSAHVNHILLTNAKAKVIPESCLMPTLEGYDVLLIREGKILRQAVTLGGRKDGRVEILSGINPGDSVVLTQNYTTQEGAEAKAVDWKGEW